MSFCVMSALLMGFLAAAPLECLVTGSVLRSPADPAMSIQVAPGFTYAGGQRFILRDVAEVEQHFFVASSGDGIIQRLYWIQFERFLPDRPGQYAYDEDRPVTLDGFELRAHVRRFTEAPAADSDRRRAYDHLKQAGYAVPAPAARVRLVHVPDKARRQEVMIVYLEPAGADDLGPERSETLLRRATAGLSLSR